jgi:hypothetical protein
MAVKVKELKDDILIDVQVNKGYYLMLKSTLFFIFQNMAPDDVKREESLIKIKSGKYEEMNEFEKAFYTISLMLAEIEQKAINSDNIVEKEVLEPGDEGYVAPTEG